MFSGRLLIRIIYAIAQNTVASKKFSFEDLSLCMKLRYKIEDFKYEFANDC